MSKIEKFKYQMLNELIENSHKGFWEDFTDIDNIYDELDYHLDKLKIAEGNGNKDEIKEYIADCANLLLMLGNAHKLYE